VRGTHWRTKKLALIAEFEEKWEIVAPQHFDSILCLVAILLELLQDDVGW
jgi:hypothetical protein